MLPTLRSLRSRSRGASGGDAPGVVVPPSELLLFPAAAVGCAASSSRLRLALCCSIRRIRRSRSCSSRLRRWVVLVPPLPLPPSPALPVLVPALEVAEAGILRRREEDEDEEEVEPPGT